MIVEMRKLNLAALFYDRDKILNLLAKTGAVQIKEREAEEGTAPSECDSQPLREYLARLESAGATIEAAAMSRKNDEKVVKDGFSLSYDEFISAYKLREEIDNLLEELDRLTEKKNAASAAKSRLANAIRAAMQYAEVPRAFSSFLQSTKSTVTKLGVIPASGMTKFEKSAAEADLLCYETFAGGENFVVAATYHISFSAEAEAILSESGFISCPYVSDENGAEQLERFQKELKAAEEEISVADDGVFALSSKLRDLKLYSDYISFEAEKADAGSKMRDTDKTFLLEAFVPATQEENVRRAISDSGLPVWYELTDPAADEEIPTLAKNNAVVENFELITNMYSPPNARELDPNTVMSFFYSVFLGFIMGDAGYGLMMLIGGGAIWLKSGKGGLKSLAGVFAAGGVFSIIWGILFNSFLGIQILPFTLMPDPQKDMYTFVGIGIPSVLVISLILGVIQLMAGYLCRAAQCWRRGQVADGIFDGLVWAVFSVGVGLALVGLVEEFHISVLATVGGIIALGALVVAILTAGRKEKFLGKITKGFGAAYGLINYFTDVLSYIRLYGLMLTGAVIAQVVSQYSIQFLTSGSVMIVVGALLMVVGHVFNLAMSLLGAYIHTARLQYVEFFGRFYEGEGTLFSPLGSELRHVKVNG